MVNDAEAVIADSLLEAQGTESCSTTGIPRTKGETLEGSGNKSGRAAKGI